MGGILCYTNSKSITSAGSATSSTVTKPSSRLSTDPEWFAAYNASIEDGGRTVEAIEIIYLNRVT